MQHIILGVMMILITTGIWYIICHWTINKAIPTFEQSFNTPKKNLLRLWQFSVNVILGLLFIWCIFAVTRFAIVFNIFTITMMFTGKTSAYEMENGYFNTLGSVPWIISGIIIATWILPRLIRQFLSRAHTSQEVV